MNELLSMIFRECADEEYRERFFEFLDNCIDRDEAFAEHDLVLFINDSGREYLGIVNMPVAGIGGGMSAFLVGGKILCDNPDGEPEIYENVEAFLRSMDDIGVMSGASLSSDLLTHDELKEIAKLGSVENMEGERIKIGDKVYLWSKNELYEQDQC